jgi:hypothetical protein
VVKPVFLSLVQEIVSMAEVRVFLYPQGGVSMEDRSIGMCISLRVSEQEKLKAIAKTHDQTVSGFIRSIIQEFEKNAKPAAAAESNE